MSNPFKKPARTLTDWQALSTPDDSTVCFATIKKESERYWSAKTIDYDVWGYQIQQNSKWREGLTDADIAEFENEMGFNFPQSLKNYYKSMNGLTMPAINVAGDRNIIPEYLPNLYSYPDNLNEIKETISWIYDSNNITEEKIKSKSISRIFPVYGHRFMLIDIPGNPILSMYGNDIIYWSDNLSRCLIIDIFENIRSPNSIMGEERPQYLSGLINKRCIPISRNTNTFRFSLLTSNF